MSGTTSNTKTQYALTTRWGIVPRYVNLDGPYSWSRYGRTLPQAKRYPSITALLTDVQQVTKRINAPLLSFDFEIVKITTTTTTTPERDVWVLQDQYTKECLGGAGAGAFVMERSDEPRAEYPSAIVASDALQQAAMRRDCPYISVIPVEITVPGTSTSSETVEVVG